MSLTPFVIYHKKNILESPGENSSGVASSDVIFSSFDSHRVSGVKSTLFTEWFSGLSGLSGLFGWVNGLLSYWVNGHWVIGSYYVSTGDHKVKSFTT